MRWLVVLSLLALVSGCKTPLSRDFPAAWPRLSVLSTEGVELDGIYENEGTLFIETGEQQPIKLTDLIPAQGDPRSGTPLPPRYAATATISLSVHIPSKELGPSQKPWGITTKAYKSQRRLEFTSDAAHGMETVKVEAASTPRTDEKNAGFVLVYSLYKGGGSLGVIGSYGETGVWLSQATDGSLIAVIEGANFYLWFMVPYFSHFHTWARFRRTAD